MGTRGKRLLGVSVVLSCIEPSTPTPTRLPPHYLTLFQDCQPARRPSVCLCVCVFACLVCLFFCVPLADCLSALAVILCVWLHVYLFSRATVAA